jgi:hypothetical protein
VRALQGEGAGPGQGTGGGSFLGGLFGTGRPAAEPRGVSVPQIGSRAVPPPGDNRTALTPQAAPTPAAPWQQAASGGGGSFLRTAMATAAGVAGGMLVAGAIRDLMGGNAQANPAGNTAATGATGTGAAGAEPRPEQAQHVDQAQQDAGYTDAAWDGGDFGGDIEI